jgi:5-methyltetrahydrofolate--homocysteine methyltransferase
MLVIGEKINATNKSVAEAIKVRDEDFIKKLAVSQAEAGADFIDLNSAVKDSSLPDNIAAMEWLVDITQEAVDKPLTIDSDVPAIIEAALKRYRGERVMINSVTAERDRLEAVGSLAAGNDNAWLVALAMGDEGIPESVEKRLEACHLIMDHLNKLGIKAEQVLFDPLVLPISVDQTQGMVTWRTIEKIKAEFPGARTVVGLSNVSFGLPDRKLVNRAFMCMAASAGLDAVIIDPLDAKAISLMRAVDLLTGRDPMCRSYIRAHRSGRIVV